MRVIVLGAGIIGICTAYWLHRNGLRVTVIERHGGPAQAASFGTAGIIGAGLAVPWLPPPPRLLPWRTHTDTGRRDGAGLELALWRWLRQARDSHRPPRFASAARAMQSLIGYSQAQMAELRERHALQYEQRAGILQLLRTDRDIALRQPLLEVLRDTGHPHALLSPAQALAQEPALRPAVEAGMPLAGALHVPADESGNCPLFARQLATLCEQGGVTFLYRTQATLRPAHGRLQQVELDDGRTLDADAVVVATGADAAALLRPLGIRTAICPVRGYSANVVVANDAIAPRHALIDDARQISLTPLGNRLRIAGFSEPGARGEPDPLAWHRLVDAGRDWLPGALDLSQAHGWHGIRPTTPDGLPLLGRTRVRGLYLNVGHGAHGWGMANGAGRLLADLIAGQPPALDLLPYGDIAP